MFYLSAIPTKISCLPDLQKVAAVEIEASGDKGILP